MFRTRNEPGMNWVLVEKTDGEGESEAPGSSLMAAAFIKALLSVQTVTLWLTFFSLYDELQL